MNLQTGPFLQAVNIQTEGGTRTTVEKGLEAVKQMLPQVNAVERKDIPASHITLALECGGSDAYSGISANPALGAAVDILVQNGGTAILSETPEIYGAEHLLTRRAKNTRMYEHLKEDMDINCGPIVDGKSTVEEKGKEIFEYILDAASGRKVKSELLGFGDTEFVPWSIGAIV